VTAIEPGASSQRQKPRRVLVLGGDGFCGWPATLHLSSLGHEVCVVDNFSRRRIDDELQVDSLTPIFPMSDRLGAWRELSGRSIEFRNFDVARQYEDLLQTLLEFRPDTLVHLAEQRAAPYSMKSPARRRYTMDNNLNATHNVLCAIVESGLDAHLVHLGSMGVYGYATAGRAIPEGYLTVDVSTDDGHRTREQILHPTHPGSVYHLTKAQDQLLFQYYNQNDKTRITDLHSGILWGIDTPETRMDPRLTNRFDYDGDYGTVLNRFVVQAAVGHPLTVHGTGEQTRAFIHLRDVVRCIEIAIDNPPPPASRVRIFNQMTEAHRIRDLASLVSGLTGAKIEFVKNPRVEADHNDLHADHGSLLGLGLEPTRLQPELLMQIAQVARKYRDRCDVTRIPCVSLWRSVA
jgi:UDP-sulfoquinovose synthase